MARVAASGLRAIRAIRDLRAVSMINLQRRRLIALSAGGLAKRYGSITPPRFALRLGRCGTGQHCLS